MSVVSTHSTVPATIQQLTNESYTHLLDSQTGKIHLNALPSLLFWPPNPTNNQLIRNSEMQTAIDHVYTTAHPNLVAMQQALSAVGMSVTMAADIIDLQARATTLQTVVQQLGTLMTMRTDKTLKDLSFPAPRILSIVSRGAPVNTKLVSFRPLFAPRGQPVSVTLQAYRRGPVDAETVLTEITVPFVQGQVVEFGGFDMHFYIRAKASYADDVSSAWLDAPQSAYEVANDRV